MMRDDLSRRFYLDVSGNGAVTIRESGERSRGMLPAFSTDTREEAESLRVLHCRLARDGSGTYWLNDFEPHSLESLEKTTDLLRASYAKLRERVR